MIFLDINMSYIQECEHVGDWSGGKHEVIFLVDYFETEGDFVAIKSWEDDSVT